MKKLYTLILLSIIILFSNQIKAQVSKRDSLALVNLYNSTNGKTWKRSTNWLRAPVKTWYGITVVDTSVTEITLFENNLRGVLPQSFGNLSGLQLIQLAYNYLNGPIPLTIGNLKNLINADFDQNIFNDTIPSSIGNCQNLEVLTFTNSKLQGHIPESIGNCIKIWNLNLSENDLSGSIPNSIGQLKQLQYLRLFQNNLSAGIPSSIGDISTLYELDLSFNKLTGSIPSSIGNLVNLYNLYLYSNRLSGSIPSSLGNLRNVFNFILNGNLLSGNIPSSLDGLVNANSIELQSNKLTGNIPSSLAQLNNLYNLLLDDNELTGTVPAAFANPNKHIGITVSYNHLSQVGNINGSNFSNPNFFSSVDHNWFTFDGLEFVASHLLMVKYSPQARINIHQHGNYLSVYAGGTLNNNTYQWSKDGVIIKTVHNDSTFHPTVSGNYSVKVTNSIATKLILYSDTIYFASSNVSSEISESKSSNESFSIFPNPAKTSTTVSFNAGGYGIIKLTDVKGNILQVKTINANGMNTLQFDVSKYSNGVYFVSLISEGRQTQTLQLNKK